MHPTASDRSLPAVLLALTASTGLIDAVSYLALGHVFTATSSSSDSPSQGRPVFPSLDPRPLSAPFLAGAVAGGRLALGTGPRHRWASAAFGIEAVLLLAAAALATRAVIGRCNARANAQAISAACLSRCSAPCARIRQRGPPAGRKSRAGLAHPVQETGP